MKLLKDIRIRTRLTLAVALLLGFVLCVILMTWGLQRQTHQDYQDLDSLKEIGPQVTGVVLLQQQYVATHNRIYGELALEGMERVNRTIEVTKQGLEASLGRFLELDRLVLDLDAFKGFFRKYTALEDQGYAINIKLLEYRESLLAEVQALKKAYDEGAVKNPLEEESLDRLTMALMNVLQDSVVISGSDAGQSINPEDTLGYLDDLIASGTELRNHAFAKNMKISGNRITLLGRQYKEGVIKHAEIQGNQARLLTQLIQLQSVLDSDIRAMDDAAENRILQRSSKNAQMMLLILVFAVVGTGISVKALSTGLLSRLQGMMAATEKIAQGDYDIQISISPRDEMGSLAESINSMAAELSKKEATLVAYGHTLEEQVSERTRELQATLDTLKRTQASLVQSEKLAAIGQLVSGIAHEINTPLGAINSSVGNMRSTLERFFATLTESLLALHNEDFSLFNRLLAEALEPRPSLSSREERRARGLLKQELRWVEPEYRDLVTDILGDIGIYRSTVIENTVITENTIKVLEFTLKVVILSRSVDTIRTAVGRAASVVNALKNLSRSDEAGSMMPYDLSEGIEMTLTLFQHRIKRGIEVVRDIQTIPLIECNPDEMNQVWTNLISNALQAMEQEGTLSVGVALHEDRVCVAIGDTGLGIPPEVGPHIFEPFFTTKPLGEGTGLGLDIARRIVEKHGGTIRYSSMPGKTVFTVEIPVEQNESL